MKNLISILIILIITNTIYGQQKYNLEPLVEDLTKKNERALKEIERLNTIINLQKATINGLKKENAGLREQIIKIEQTHKQQIADLLANNDHLRDNYQKLQEAYDNLLSQLEQKTAFSETLLQQLKEKSTLIEHLYKENEKYIKNYAELQSGYKNLQEKVEKLSEDNIKFQENNIKLTKSLSEEKIRLTILDILKSTDLYLTFHHDEGNYARFNFTIDLSYLDTLFNIDDKIQLTIQTEEVCENRREENKNCITIDKNFLKGYQKYYFKITNQYNGKKDRTPIVLVFKDKNNERFNERRTYSFKISFTIVYNDGTSNLLETLEWKGRMTN